MSTRNGSLGARPERLEQVLALQEQFLAGDTGVPALGARICQSTVLVLGAGAARLVALRQSGGWDVLAAYGSMDMDPSSAAADQLRRTAREHRPLVWYGENDGFTLLTFPLDVGNATAILQMIDRPERRFAADDVALARYAASLAGVALRTADARQTPSETRSEAFVALSHDLRQPLGVILGYTRLLIEGAYGPCDQEQGAILAAVERHAHEMHRLLDGALDLAQAERERRAPSLAEVSLRDLLEEICSGSLAHRVPAGVTLTWNADPALERIRTDRFRVRQMLQNLVDNALRHTHTGAVSINATRSPAAIRLVVEDTGSGMDADTLGGLFSPFRPGAGGGPTGRGCGLYLVKRFAEALGGQVSVESALGIGTRFTIDLPAPT